MKKHLNLMTLFTLVLLLCVATATPAFADDVPSINEESTLSEGTVGMPYTHEVSVTGATGYSIKEDGGTLPPGLTLDGNIISGEASEAGTFTFTFVATNASGDAEKELTIVIKDSAPVITTDSLPNGETEVEYSATLGATGSGTLTWEIVAGELPAGLSLNAETGEISGTPDRSTGEIIYHPVFRVSNSGGFDEKELEFTVYTSTVYVDDFVSNPSNAREGINNALWRAAALAQTKGSSVTVKFTQGKTYIVDNILYMYSNTAIEATGATIKMQSHEHGGSILKAAHTTDGHIASTPQSNRCQAEEFGIENPKYCGNGKCITGGYSQATNLSINGGTWVAVSAYDQNKDSQCIQIRHSSNITLTNMTLKGNSNHAMNLSGSENIVIRGCEFTGQVKRGTTPTHYIEAIHLDHCIDGNESNEPNVRPQDGMPVKDVVVDNCTFTNVFAGVGCHATNPAGKKASNVTVSNCTFKNLYSGSGNSAEYGHAIAFASGDGITVTNNTVNGASHLANMYGDATNVVIENNENVTNIKDKGIYFLNSSGRVSNNNISMSGDKTYGLSLDSGSVCEATGNTFSGASSNGVYVKGATLTLNDNTISCVGTANGIGVHNNGVLKAAGNTINAPGDGVIAGKNGDSNDLNNNVTLTNNTINSAGKKGVNIFGGTINAQQNIIKQPGAEGIYINGATGTLKTNTVTKSGSHGISILNGASISTSKNTVDTTISGKNGINIDASKANLDGDTIKNAGNRGVNVQNSVKNSSIKNLVVTASAHNGIHVVVKEQIDIEGNRVEGSKNYGIQLQKSSSVSNFTATIKNNHSVNNQGLFDYKIDTGASNATITNLKDNHSGMRFKKPNFSIPSGKTLDPSNTVCVKLVTVSGLSNENYTGKKITPKPTVTILNKVSDGTQKFELVEGTHYTLEYEDNVNVGKAKITIKGKGIFGDSITKTFNIVEAGSSVAGATISGLSDKTYTGSAIKPTPTVKLDGKTLKSGTDYTVSYKNNINAGKATVTITGKGSYGGTKSATFQIKPVSLAKAIVTNVEDKPYTGKAVTQTPTVKLDGKTLKSGTDYTLSYKNNKNAGTATMTVTGKGNYSGTVSKTFKIIAKSKIWERVAGQTGFDTMAAITKKFGNADNAVIAANSSFRDSLAAAGLAGSLQAPMMLTNPGGLPDQTKSELKRMGVKTVYLVGSTKDVSAAVETQIKNLGIKVVRITGNTPSQKAVNVAKKQPSKSDTVIIATPAGFKDALSISPYAYATKSPVLYAENNKKLSGATVNYIKTAGFKKAIIVGGYIALPLDIETQLKGAGIKASNITRLAGANGYATSQVIAEWGQGKVKNGTGTNGQGKGAKDLYYYAMIKFQPTIRMTANNVGISRGDTGDNNWRDALAGAALCGKNRAILLLVHDENTSNTAVTKASKAQIAHGYVFGGEGAVGKKSWNALVKSTN